MLGFRISTLALILHLGLGCANNILPLNLTTDASSLIASNLTNEWIPPGLKFTLHNSGHPPLSALGMYLNAIKVMAIVALQDQRKTWEFFHWGLPEYDVLVFFVSSAPSGAPSGLQTSFVVWCIEFVMYSVSRLRRYSPLVADIYWQDVKVGKLAMTKRAQPTPTIAATSLPQRNVGLGNSSSVLNATEDPSSLSDSSGSFVVFYDYRGVTLNSIEIFLVVLEAMKRAANEGADGFCLELWSESPTVRFYIKSEMDQYGKPLLRYRHVVRLLKKVAFKMVSNRRFAEMLIVLELNGVKAAEAAFTKSREPHAGASNGIQIAR